MNRIIKNEIRKIEKISKALYSKTKTVFFKLKKQKNRTEGKPSFGAMLQKSGS